MWLLLLSVLFKEVSSVTLSSFEGGVASVTLSATEAGVATGYDVFRTWNWIEAVLKANISPERTWNLTRNLILGGLSFAYVTQKSI